MLGGVIGKYRLVSELGKGGMGVVYVAEHVQLGRAAALKMLLPQFSTDEGIVERFFKEARALSAIEHPGIVEIYDYGKHTDGRAYIVMALLKGETLQERLTFKGPMQPVEGATLVAQVAAALAAAHGRGIIHRDLKPDNIFLVANELMPFGVQAKLLDFGIAKLADDQASFKTQTGSLIGTPAYMSPEQCMGRSDLDHRTDLYALGCILFHVLTGRPPFISEAGAGPMIAAHLRDPAPDPRGFNPQVSDALAGITLRLLEKDPRARFQTALEARDALMLAGANVSLTRPMDAQPQPVGSGARTVAYRGPEAYNPTTTPTTASGTAAERIKRTQAPPRRTGAWLAFGAVVLAIGGIATYAAVSRDDSPTPSTASTSPTPSPARSGTTTGTSPSPASTGTSSPATSTPPSPSPTASPSSTASPSPSITGALVAGPAGTEQPAGEKSEPQEPCPQGQSRGIDTNGHCCWPEQAWSTAKARCIGTPKCPPGTTPAKGDDCIARIATAPVPPPSPSPSTSSSTSSSPSPSTSHPGESPVPKFTLASKTIEPEGTIVISFAQPVPSRSPRRAWVTVIDAGRSSDSYGTWEYVADNAKSASLKAPTKPGNYEVRVHTDYPTLQFNVRYAVPIEVKGDSKKPVTATGDVPVTPAAKQRFTLSTTKARTKAGVLVTFEAPMRAIAGERFWITTVKADAGPSVYGEYEYIPDRAKSMSITMPAKPGEYEVRLHANYPTKSTNVVHRVRIQVTE